MLTGKFKGVLAKNVQVKFKPHNPVDFKSDIPSFGLWTSGQC